MFATRAMQIQAVAFLAFGLVLFIIPDVYNELFGWEDADTVLGRLIGATFIGLGWVELNSARRGDALPFAVVPTLLVLAFVWEMTADTFAGPDEWIWFNGGVSAAFAVMMWAAVFSDSR